MELAVSFRGKSVVVTGVAGGTAVQVLKEKLEGLTGVPVANQKLVRGRMKGRIVGDRQDRDTRIYTIFHIWNLFICVDYCVDTM